MVLVVVLAVSLSVVLAAVLSFASKALYVYEDPRLQDVVSMLPQANCGNCGNPGCKAMGEAILAEDAKLTSCKPGTQEMREAIAEYLASHPDEDGEYTKVKM
ncbi:electron transporter RnfB [Mycoplasmatota bacterium]|nr:electron transporter RnfB [Mycoplasmatota bacterium]